MPSERLVQKLTLYSIYYSMLWDLSRGQRRKKGNFAEKRDIFDKLPAMQYIGMKHNGMECILRQHGN